MTVLRSTDQNADGWQSLYVTSRDGLRLHTRHYTSPPPRAGAPTPPPSTPIIMLPGLTRNAADFHILARALTRDPERPVDVYAMDYRGRGRSDHDPEWENYTPHTECLDVLDFLTAMNIPRVDCIGTSRGGIIAMLMATLRPATLGSVVLNDIGPQIEAEGLTRIIGYVGKVPLPKTWDEAIALVRQMNEAHFTALNSQAWETFARQLYLDEDGKPASAYDRNLSKAISSASGEVAPTLWPQFEALKSKPLLIIRGEHSDLLSQETCDRMLTLHPDAQLHTVPHQGHAPLLIDDPTIDRIIQFIRR